MRTANRCRACPDQGQQAVLTRTFGCVRVVRNRTLATRQARWHLQCKGTSYAESGRALTAMKKDPDLAFLAEVPSVPLQQALRDQRKAFAAFFAGRARYPRFKSRRGRQSAHYTRSVFTLRNGVLRLAKMAAPVRFTWPWHLERKARALARYQRRLARRHDVIAIEDLDVAGLVRSRHLARAISGCGWAGFRRQLACKCQRHGRRLVVTGRWYPSSKTCPACGHRLAGLSLGPRRWTCPARGARHDRDVNAARNIRAAGRAAARGSPGDACGAGVSHSGSSRVRPAVKHEPRPARAGIPVLQGRE